MKKIILWIFIFLCFIPLYSKIDNYEDLISQSYMNKNGSYFDGTHETIWESGYFKSDNTDTKCLANYDWSSIQARFIPFWTLVTACSDDYYFHLFGIFKIHFNKN